MKKKKVIEFFNRINFNFKVINFRENIDLCQHFAGLFKTMAIKTNFLVYNNNNNCVLWQWGRAKQKLSPVFTSKRLYLVGFNRKKKKQQILFA